MQLPRMLYRLAEQIDGRSSYAEIAQRFGDAVRRNVQTSDVQMLVEERLRPLWIVAQPDGADPVALRKVDPLLALKFRAALVPDGAVRSLTTIFRPLFFGPVLAAAVLAMLALDGWLFFVHGISQSLRHTLYHPALMLMVIGGVVLATAFHEIGHATACRYGGAKPGVMGVGIYIVWPAFYTDVTDAYRLGKWGRLRTDIGGMYFNAIFALLVAGAYALTSFEPLLLLIVLQNLAILQQSLPFLRLDGYYILSDLTGVPDIFLQIRSVLASLIPGRRSDQRVTELKSWVRVVVTAYVLLVVLFLAVTLVAMIINLPRLLATGYDSAALHYQAIGPDFSSGQTPKGVLDAIQMVFLLLPGVGLAYTAARVGRRSVGGAFSWSSGRPKRRALVAFAGAGAVALAAFSWWPNGEYRPIQPGERGTLSGLIGQIDSIPSGRPSLTVTRQQQLHGAPTERRLLQGAGGGSATRGGSQGPRGRSTTSPSGSGKTTTPTQPEHTSSTAALTTPTSATPAPTTSASTTPAATTPPTTTTAPAPAAPTPTTPAATAPAGGTPTTTSSP